MNVKDEAFSPGLGASEGLQDEDVFRFHFLESGPYKSRRQLEIDYLDDIGKEIRRYEERRIALLAKLDNSGDKPRSIPERAALERARIDLRKKLLQFNR